MSDAILERGWVLMHHDGHVMPGFFRRTKLEVVKLIGLGTWTLYRRWGHRIVRAKKVIQPDG